MSLNLILVPEPVVLISNRYYIRNITLDGTHEKLVVKELTNAVALDFDWQEHKIYWSDTTSTQSRIMRMNEDGNKSSWEVNMNILIKGFKNRFTS